MGRLPCRRKQDERGNTGYHSLISGYCRVIKMEPAAIIKPPLFGTAADACRMFFDYGNDQLVNGHFPVDVVFIGDSITHMWEVQSYFGHLGHIVNRGISGDVAEIMIKRLEADAVQLKPRICVSLIGINNIYEMCIRDSYRSSYKGGTRQDIKDGKGTVIVYGPDYSVDNLDSILREQLAKLVPFSFSKDVEYLVNVKNGSLIVTVINNTGVTKAPSQQEVIDKSKTINLKVKYTGNLKIQKVNELYYGKSEKVSGNAVDVTLGPGEYKVLEFVFG